jgi:hypothetical protein
MSRLQVCGQGDVDQGGVDQGGVDQGAVGQRVSAQGLPGGFGLGPFRT